VPSTATCGSAQLTQSVPTGPDNRREATGIGSYGGVAGRLANNVLPGEMVRAWGQLLQALDSRVSEGKAGSAGVSPRPRRRWLAQVEPWHPTPHA